MKRRFAVLMAVAAVAALVAMSGAAVAQSAASVIRCNGGAQGVQGHASERHHHRQRTRR